jgi:hypothetical protein
MKKFNDIILEKKKDKNKYEYQFDGNVGYVVDNDTKTIIVYSNIFTGQEFLEKAVTVLNKKRGD